MSLRKSKCWSSNDRRVHIRHQCSKANVLSCHRCLINAGIEKNTHLNIDYNVDHQMSLSNSKCWYSNDRRANIRHQCRNATVLSCYRCLINTGVEQMHNI